MTSPSPLWFLDRAAGEVTLLLLTAVVVLGIVRAAAPTWRPFVIEGLHTNIALLVALFAGIHVVAALIDPFAHLGVTDAVVPFISPYRSLWLGLGVVSAYLYIASVALSWPARRLPRAVWLWVHRTMYVGWALALLHSLGAGSDARNAIFLVLDVVAVATVLTAFLAARVVSGLERRPGWWTLMALLAVTATVAFVVWTATGPLEPGWAKDSGTPVNLLKAR